MKNIFIVFSLVLGFQLVAQQPFVFTVKTDNPGVSSASSFTIPVEGTANYNFEVDWDYSGTFVPDQTDVFGEVTHDYGVAGVYTIAIRGGFPHIFFNNGGDKDKVLTIEQWGQVMWESFNNAFRGCSNMVINATDVPDLSNVNDLAYSFSGCSSLVSGNFENWNVESITSMAYMFSGAVLFNTDISGWDISSVFDLSHMFDGAASFDQNLGGWNISSAGNFEGLFTGTNLSIENYDNTLIGFADDNGGTETIPPEVIFDASAFYCNGEAARQFLSSNYFWSINDNGKDCSLQEVFVITVKTDNPGTTNSTSFSIPTTGGGYNYSVDWDFDGAVFTPDQTNLTGTVEHDYGTAGTYTIAILGTFPRIYFNNGNDKEKLVSIDQWGAPAWTSMAHAFYGCSNLTINATDAPNLSSVISMTRMFENAASLNSDLNNWDVQNVETMDHLFEGATLFNGNITNWDVSTVWNMYGMFEDAIAFNQNIGAWNVSNVTGARNLFHGASSFDQDISAWNVSSITLFDGMFEEASSFNQDLSNWDVSNAVNLVRMFQHATSFNQPLNWNTGSAQLFDDMFHGATSFNQDISSWDVSSARNFIRMFQDATSFNQPLPWTTTSLQYTDDMFNGATAFDQPIAWTAPNLIRTSRMFKGATGFNQPITLNGGASYTYMNGMFEGATSFNQDLSGWDVSNIISMNAAFNGATAFDQSLANWDISSVTNMTNMLNNAAMSVCNYELTLQGWLTLDGGESQIPSNLTLGATGLVYGLAGETTRSDLVSTHTWNFSGDARIPQITDVISECVTYDWIDGNTYTADNNTASHVLQDQFGCDSIEVFLDLTILQPTTGVDIQTACDTYTWIDGNEYTANNNTATFVLTNSVGCDSTVTLNLTIKNTTTGVDTQVACDSYTWIDGNEYTADNNTATYVLTNSVGCDSTVTLNLTITNSTTGVDVQTACDTYTWIDGNDYTADNNTATYVLTNSVGCDSTVTLDLTITNSTTGVDVQTACDTYTWIDGNEYTADNNTATYVLTNSVGCDSIVTLNLTITNSTTGVDTRSACESLTWIDGNVYTTNNNSATHVLTNSVGCDSLVTLNLTIEGNPVPVSAGNDTILCRGANFELPSLQANTEWLSVNDEFNLSQSEDFEMYILKTIDPLTLCSSRDTLLVTYEDAPQLDFTVTDATCAGNDGEISFVLTGSSSYEVYWSSGDSTVTNVSDLSSGMYYVYVESANGCSYTNPVALSSTEVFITVDNVIHPSCYGVADGAIDVSASGGNGVLSYYWDSYGSLEDISGLMPGTYLLEVSDEDDCVTSIEVELNQPDELVVDYSVIAADCGVSNGAIEGLISASSTIDYNYLDEQNNSVGTSASLIDVQAGIYTMVYADQLGCGDSLTIVVPTVNGPEILVDTAHGATCDNDGFIETIVNSSNGVASIDWSNGETNEIIQDLAPGFYYVRVEDNLGCANYQGVWIREEQPEKIDICLVTVDTILTQNVIVWERPLTTEIVKFRIYRETNTVGQFMLVGEQPFSDETIFFDTVAAAHNKSWRYRIAAVNDCDVEAIWSDYHKTIHLTTEEDAANVYLNWDDYEGFNYGNFIVTRHTDATGWEDIDTLEITQFSYVDPIDPLTPGLDYKIEIDLGYTCTSSKARDHRRTRSNRSLGLMIPSPEDEEEDNTAGLSEVLENVQVYPIPTNESVIIESSQIGSFKIYDGTGRLIQSGDIAAGRTLIDNLASGIFIIKIQIGNEVKHVKIEKL